MPTLPGYQSQRTISINGQRVSVPVTVTENGFENIRTVLQGLGIHTGPQGGHHNHFHVDVRRPDRVALPPNLLADEAALNQTQTVADEGLLVAAQALLEQVQPTLNFEQGDVTMFVMDVPPDVPPQYAPVVIAQASQAKDPKTDRTIGVCALVQNPIQVFDALSGLKGQYSAVNNIGPLAVLGGYFWGTENQQFDIKSARVSILKNPQHGTLELRTDSDVTGYHFIPEPSYFGPDRATFLVEFGGRKIKLEYFIKVMKTVPGGTEGYDPYWDPELCPNGSAWEISLNPDDPNAPIYTFDHPYQLTNALAGVVQANLTFADLAGGALGETVGNTITLDNDAAGHGWFLDTTPWDNAEYVATSNPNEWVALPGTEAAGKMDLLTVLLHEYGHVLGLDHSDNTHSLMSEDLQPGMRRTVSVEDMEALWSYLGDSVSTNPNSPNSPFNPLPLGSSLLFGFTRLRRPEGQGQGINLPPLPGDPNAVSVTPAPIYSMARENLRALHPDLYNGDFATLDATLAQYGWDTLGNATIENGSLVLREHDRAMSGITQGFILPDGIQALRFTLRGAQFTANGNTPPDAFEVALLDRATSQSVVGTGALSHTDSLFNLQSNGLAYGASGVTVTGLPAPGTGLPRHHEPQRVGISCPPYEIMGL